MLFHRSVISFVAAIALAGGVTASVTLVRRSGPICTPGTGALACCNSKIAFSGLSDDDQNLLAALVSNLDIGLAVGLNCTNPGPQGSCPQQTCCTDGILSQGDLVGVAPNCVSAVIPV